MNQQIEIEVSARHIHLSKKDYEILFGIDNQYKNLRELSQKGQFATDKKVVISNNGKTLDARFLAPFRDKTQVELSLTDCHHLGITAPYKINVDSESTEITISGSIGEIHRRSAIISQRHLHTNPIDSQKIGVSDGDRIAVKITTERGTIIFDDIVVRVEKDFQTRVHLDLDEGNAAGIVDKCYGEILKK